jgi:hypothetical protein
VLGVVLALATSGAMAASSACADGDPASDVLATQPLFLPWDAGVPAGTQAQLGALLHAAQRGDHPVRVALIASPADLGSVSVLWRRPQSYAEFLAEELSLVYRGPLLVVMPNGFGVAHASLTSGVLGTALAGVPVPRTGLQLAGDALLAVTRMAAASGHPLAAVSATTAPARNSSDLTAWIAFVLGAILLAAAWTASLRAQPLRRRRRSLT